MKLSKRTLANRGNARYATGPVTVQGKWRSSRNALTHGLTSKILPDSLRRDGTAPNNGCSALGVYDSLSFLGTESAPFIR